MRETPRVAEAQHWMDLARSAVRLARQAIDEAGRTGECAVAFAISEEANSPARRETLELLGRALADDPPDLVLMETLTLVRDPETYETVQLLLETGLPRVALVPALPARRLRRPGPALGPSRGRPLRPRGAPVRGDGHRRAARQLPSRRARGGDDLVAPRLHERCPSACTRTWACSRGASGASTTTIGPEEYAELALEWRDEGAQIIGGCCGVTPAHIAAARDGRSRTRRPGSRRPREAASLADEPGADRRAAVARRAEAASLYPLPFPELAVDPGVFVPTMGSYLVWKTLFATEAGKDSACLDVGCGCGILAVQLALNGAERVHAIDIDRDAVANTLANAFRNGVADRITGEAVNFYHWAPSERFDLVVASLYQMPVDPYEEPTGHRPLDYWGRNLIDHFIRLLPNVLTPDGVAYLMQLSIIGQRADGRAARASRVSSRGCVDYSFFPFDELFAPEPRADRARRAALRRVPPSGRGRGRHGRVPPRDHPRLRRRTIHSEPL